MGWVEPTVLFTVCPKLLLEGLNTLLHFLQEGKYGIAGNPMAVLDALSFWIFPTVASVVFFKFCVCLPQLLQWLPLLGCCEYALWWYFGSAVVTWVGTLFGWHGELQTLASCFCKCEYNWHNNNYCHPICIAFWLLFAI